MNRNQAKEFYPFLQAFAEGKIIETRRKPSAIKGTSVPNNWAEMTEIEFWNNTEYRIKPESKYRPFKNAEECWQEMLKHQPFGWLMSQNGEVNSLIIFIDNEGIVIGDRNNGVIGFVTATDLFKIKFADGTPFGVKMEE
jgi:hypothetical protein